jgi:chaperonin GroES
VRDSAAAAENVRTKAAKRIDSLRVKRHARPVEKVAKLPTNGAAEGVKKKMMTQPLERRVGDWDAEQLRLVGGRVLIERDEVSERVRHDSVIIRPQMSTTDAEEKRYATGKIVAMGPGMKVGKSPRWKGDREGPKAFRWPMPDVDVGARVIYRTWAVRGEFTRNGKKFDLVSDEVIDVVISKGVVSMASFRPLSDRILVKRLDALGVTKGGIIIPDISKEKPVEGDVLAVGPGRVQVDGSVRPLDMVVGDRVLFGKFSGTEIHIDGVECLILREEDVLAIVEKPAEEKPAEGAAAE